MLIIDEPICGSPTLLPSSSNCHQLPLAFDFTRMTALVSAFPLLPAWAWPPATWARPSVRPSRSGLPHAQSTNAQCGPGGGITVSSLPVMHVRSRSVRREDGRGVELPGIGTDRILENTTLPKPIVHPPKTYSSPLYLDTFPSRGELLIRERPVVTKVHMIFDLINRNSF